MLLLRLPIRIGGRRPVLIGGRIWMPQHTGKSGLVCWGSQLNLWYVFSMSKLKGADDVVVLHGTSYK